MRLFESLLIALSTYSAVPVPQLDWNEKNMRYAMCAFPLIGVVIGAAWCACGALWVFSAARRSGCGLYLRRRRA